VRSHRTAPRARALACGAGRPGRGLHPAQSPPPAAWGTPVGAGRRPLTSHHSSAPSPVCTARAWCRRPGTAPQGNAGGTVGLGSSTGSSTEAGTQNVTKRCSSPGKLAAWGPGGACSCSSRKRAQADGATRRGRSRTCTAQGWCTRRRISISPRKSPSAISLEPLRILAATSVPYLRGTTAKGSGKERQTNHTTPCRRPQAETTLHRCLLAAQARPTGPQWQHQPCQR
jgi:hypothetical protein